MRPLPEGPEPLFEVRVQHDQVEIRDGEVPFRQVVSSDAFTPGERVRIWRLTKKW
ncbi:hypothetical protein CCP3SC15_7090002 [Gammaproteobacteria bacterium]